jgi:hypothetical protein
VASTSIIYQDFNNKISINYFIDLLEVLAENGLDQSELDSLACVLFLSLEGTPLGEKLKWADDYHDCYQVLIENIDLFDSNFIYTFELTRRHVQIRAFLNFEKHEHINWTKVKIDRLLRYRQILAGWIPYLSKLPPILPECKIDFYKHGIDATYNIRFTNIQASLLSAD